MAFACGLSAAVRYWAVKLMFYYRKLCVGLWRCDISYLVSHRAPQFFFKPKPCNRTYPTIQYKQCNCTSFTLRTLKFFTPKYILKSHRYNFGSICDQNGRNFGHCKGDKSNMSKHFLFVECIITFVYEVGLFMWSFYINNLFVEFTENVPYCHMYGYQDNKWSIRIWHFGHIAQPYTPFFSVSI